MLRMCLWRPWLVLRVITNIIDAGAETDRPNPLLQPTRSHIYISDIMNKLVQF